MNDKRAVLYYRDDYIVASIVQGESMLASKEFGSRRDAIAWLYANHHDIMRLSINL